MVTRSDTRWISGDHFTNINLLLLLMNDLNFVCSMFYVSFIIFILQLEMEQIKLQNIFGIDKSCKSFKNLDKTQ